MAHELHIPDSNDSLGAILVFALEYNAYERLAADPAHLGEVVEPIRDALDRGERIPEWAGSDLLRGALFFYQRMTHHWGEVSPAADRSMRLLVAAIRERSQQHPDR